MSIELETRGKENMENIRTSLKLLHQEMGFIKEGVDDVKKQVERIDNKVSGEFLTKVEFEAKFYPVRIIVFGLASLLMTGVILAILSGIFKSVS